MNLKQANEKLIETMELLTEKIPAIEKLETQYYQTYYKILLNAPQRSAEGREAHAKLTIQQDEIATQYLDAKYEVRVLLTRKEMLIEICKNLRTLGNYPIDKE